VESETVLGLPHPRPARLRWAAARLFFIGYVGFSMVTVIGGFLTAPLMTWYFLGDRRFWRYWRVGARLLAHGFHLLQLIMRDRRGFMFSVPLTSPPRSIPNTKAMRLNPEWRHRESCGNCNNCCYHGAQACPLLDTSAGLCLGYNSFYWRYFNCGRFPSVLPEIHYYDCRKWVALPELEPQATEAAWRH
jgi:hypothetical protein